MPTKNSIEEDSSFEEKPSKGENFSKLNYSKGKWTDKEHSLFIQACSKYGNDWSQVFK